MIGTDRFLISEIRHAERLVGRWQMRRDDAVQNARNCEFRESRSDFVRIARDANRWLVMHKAHSTGLQNNLLEEIRRAS